MNVFLRRLSILLAAITIFAMLGVVARPSQAKGADNSVTTHAVMGSRGAKPAVKLSRDDANKNAKPHPGGKSRSGILHINNHGKWYVDIYVDGDYEGTVAPYGDLYIADTGDDARVYGDVSATAYSYGPRDIGVPGVWNLY